IFLNPCPQAGPLAQQRFVCGLQRPLEDRQEAAVGEESDHLLHVLAALGSELLERGRPALDSPFVVNGGKPQKHAAGKLLLLCIELAESALPEPPYGAMDSPGALIGGMSQPPTFTSLPQLEQGGRQQRQRSGLALDIADERVDELGVNV